MRTTGVRMAKVLNKTEETVPGSRGGQHVEHLRLSYTIWRSIYCYSHFRKLAGSTGLPHDSHY